MPDIARTIDPDWSKEAGIAINSPYWHVDDESLEGEDFQRAAEAKLAEFEAFRDAAEAVERFEDLPPQMQALYWKAIEALADEIAQELLDARFHGEDIAYEIVEPAKPGEAARLQKEMAALIVQLRESGRDDDAKVIASLTVEQFAAFAEQARAKADEEADEDDDEEDE